MTHRIELALLTLAVELESIASHIPPYSLFRCMVLDTLWGRAEDTEYVSTTAPPDIP